MLPRKKSYRTMLGVCMLFLFIGVAISMSYRINEVAIANASSLQNVSQVIIDPGHGGIDPGAVGVGGVIEKDINLAISLCLRDILIANGYEVIMTREEDISIHDKQFKGVSKIKTSDLKNRLRIMEDHPNAIAVSIHQNKYPSESSSGAQMFYGRKNDQSKLLAESLQAAFKNNLQQQNDREVKQSTSSVYIIHNAKIPITLVECGFLSNYADAALLSGEEYQYKVAFTIFTGIVNSRKIS